MNLTYREVMPWIVGRNKNELLQLMKVCLVGCMTEGFDADYDKMILMDGFFAGQSYNQLVEQIEANAIVDFDEYDLRDLVAVLKAGLAPVEVMKIMRNSGLVNVLERNTINSTFITILRAICKKIIVAEYKRDHRMED